MDAVARLSASLGARYEIEGEIGRGGMAVVYRARDRKHHRFVALKVLNPELGAVLGTERFLSEIQVTAKLQHPNLLPLFDSGDADGLLYYVMPCVEGESLRAILLREKQLPVDQAIHIASAIASALDFAHRHGVIHRDLKPENILLLDGQPLVADFGIALAVAAAGGDRVTQTGISLGTPQYMSPEQATGDRVIDARTDVYSLGAVTYEMLTGEPPHLGTSAQAIIARLLTDTVRSVRSSRPSVPEHVEAAVMRAIEKLPADRWQSAHEFADALAGRAGSAAVSNGARTPAAITGAKERRRSRALISAGAFIAGSVLAAVAAATIGFRRDTAPSVSFVVEPPVHNGVQQVIEDFALSPDGQTIAIVAGTGADYGARAYLRRLTEARTTLIPGTENANRLAFSPDGEWLGVLVNDGRLLKLRIADPASAITVSQGNFAYSGLAWIDNESIVLGARSDRPGLGRVAATGGPTRTLTRPRSPAAHAWPFVTPDRKHVLFLEWGPGFFEDDFLAIGSLVTGEFRTTSLLAAQAFGIVDDRILYSSGSSLLAVPFDANGLSVTGTPTRVAEGLTADYRTRATLSPSGTLAYRRGQPTSRLLLLDRDGRIQELSSGGHAVSSVPGGSGLRFSPDGQRVAIDFWMPSGDTTVSHIWTFDVRTRTFTRLAALGNVGKPDWTPDGRRLVFTTWSAQTEHASVWIQDADGTRAPERVYEAPPNTLVSRASITPDGKGVLFCHQPPNVTSPESELAYVTLSGKGTAERLVDEPMSELCQGRVSPDGRWLAYVAAEGTTTDVYVRPFRRPGSRVRVSEGRAASPTWSRDGKRVFYSSESGSGGEFWATAATIRETDGHLQVVNHERLVRLTNRLFDVSPDGRQILAVEETYNDVQLVVTTNWLPQLRARLAGHF